MQPIDDGFSLWVTVPLKGREVIFRKEPAYKGHNIIRGALPTGQNKKEYLCFAFDTSEHRLYLDLNRNLDLTDDPVELYHFREFGNKTVGFDAVHIETELASHAIPYVIDMVFSSSRSGDQMHVIVRSGWQGEIELYGKTWQMTVLDNMDGIIGAGDMLFLFPDGEPYSEATRFSFINRIPMPEQLFFDGHGYDLGFRFETDTGYKNVLTVTFSDTNHEMGTLAIGGKSIQRLYIYDYASKRRNAVILDSPGSNVPIPKGLYGSFRVILEETDSHSVFYTDCMQKLYVDADKTIPLKIGGPLNNEVKINRGGMFLSMSYRLVGIGEEQYRLQNIDTNVTPAFTVYSGNRKIGSGHFRYG